MNSTTILLRFVPSLLLFLLFSNLNNDAVCQRPVVDIDALQEVVDFQHPSWFKRKPTSDELAPSWAIRMYSGDLDFQGIVDERAACLSRKPYEKTIHERNFKHWLMQVEHCVDASGRILLPNVWAREQWRQSEQKGSQGTDGIWDPIGPFETYNKESEGGIPVSWQSNVYCFDQCASNPQICAAGIEAGDLFMSADQGLTWSAVTEGVPGIRTVRAVKIAPSDANRIYFESNQWLYGSSDGGTTWSMLADLGEHATQIAVHPTNPDVVLVSTWNGLHRTIDGGNSWSMPFTGTTWDVVYHPSDPTVVYSLRYGAALNRCEMHRSDDGGQTFALKDNGYFVPSEPSNASADGGRLGVTPADADRVYVALIGKGKSTDTGWIGMYQSLNRGDSWLNLNGQDGAPYDETLHPSVANGNLNGTGIYQGFYDFDLAVSHNDPNTAWVGVTALSATHDGGATWQRIGAYSASTYDIGWIHPDIQDLSVQGNHIWVATDGGLNYSSDELVTHESRKRGIYNSTYWGFGHGWNTDLQVGGRYHNGNTGFLSTYGQGNHMRLGGAESPTGYVHPLKDGGLLARFSDISDVVVPSDLSGVTSVRANLGMYPNESYVDFRNSELVVDPRYGNHMVLGNGSGLYKSIDGGNQWNVWMDWGTSSTVYEIEQGFDDPGRWYVVVRSGGTCKLFRSTNNGGSWGQLTSGLPTNWGSMEIALNPSDANDIWVMQAGGERLFRSANGGGSWDEETNALWAGESLREVLAIGGRGIVLLSSHGAYFYDNMLGLWSDASTGLPAFWAPLEGAVHYASGAIRVADKGKGVWEAGFPFPTAPAARPMTADPEVYCAGDTVVFDCHSVLLHDGATWEWAFSPTPAFVSSVSDRRIHVVFGQGGSYDVTLSVTDASGQTSSMTHTDMVTVGNPEQCQPDAEIGGALICGGNPQFGLTHDLDVTTNTYTAMAWVRPNGIQPDYTGIVLGGESAAGLNFRPNNELAYHWPGGAWWWSSGLVVPADAWSHVALVVSPNSVKVVLNGIEAVHNTSTEAVAMGAQWLGSYRGWASRNFDGQIDEVKIWNRALTLDEVRDQRHLNLALEEVAADADLLGYYQFNEEANFLVNKKPASNHGELSGGATLGNSSAPVGFGQVYTLNMLSSGNLVSPIGTWSILTASAPLGTEIRLHQMSNMPFAPVEPMEERGGWWIANAYASSTSSAPMGADWTGTWNMHNLPSAAPWTTPDSLAGIEVWRRDVNGIGTWSLQSEATLGFDPQGIEASSTWPLESQWMWGSDACAIDSTALTLCPGESWTWQNGTVDAPGTYWTHEDNPEGCDGLSVLELDVAEVPALTWNVTPVDENSLLEVSGEWLVQAWTFNGQLIAGANESQLLTDLDGNYGVVAVHLDTGCLQSYESMLGCPGDVDGDMSIGVGDVLAYLSAFGCSINCGVADLNGDGAVNTTDLLMMLSLFGSVCE